MVKNLRIVLIGQKGVGKSEIIGKLLYGDNSESFVASDEDIHLAVVDTDRGTREKVRIMEVNLDPNGDIKLQLDQFKHYYQCEVGYRTTAKKENFYFINIIQAFILVVDLTSEESLQIAEIAKQTVDKAKEKKETVCILLANKSDLSSQRKLDSVELQKWATREKMKLYEVSALDRESIVSPFCGIVSKLVLPQSKFKFVYF